MIVIPKFFIPARIEEIPEFIRAKIEEHLERRRELFHRDRDETYNLKFIPNAQNLVLASSAMKCLRPPLLAGGHGFASSFGVSWFSLIRKKHLIELGSKGLGRSFTLT